MTETEGDLNVTTALDEWHTYLKSKERWTDQRALRQWFKWELWKAQSDRQKKRRPPLDPEVWRALNDALGTLRAYRLLCALELFRDGHKIGTYIPPSGKDFEFRPLGEAALERRSRDEPGRYELRDKSGRVLLRVDKAPSPPPPDPQLSFAL